MCCLDPVLEVCCDEVCCFLCEVEVVSEFVEKFLCETVSYALERST